MHFAAAVFLLTFPAFAQIQATAKPLSIEGTADALGGGKVGFWKVDLCSSYPVPVDLSRARVTQAFPALRELPNRLAEDLVTRRASNSFWSVVARWGPPLVSSAGAAFATRGIILGNNTQIWIGQGTSVLAMLFTRAGQRAPNPGLYWSEMMPDRVSIPANDCGTGWLIASGLIKGAAPMSATFELPGLESAKEKARLDVLELLFDRMNDMPSGHAPCVPPSYGSCGLPGTVGEPGEPPEAPDPDLAAERLERYYALEVSAIRRFSQWWRADEARRPEPQTDGRHSRIRLPMWRWRSASDSC